MPIDSIVGRTADGDPWQKGNSSKPQKKTCVAQLGEAHREGKAIRKRGREAKSSDGRYCSGDTYQPRF